MHLRYDKLILVLALLLASLPPLRADERSDREQTTRVTTLIELLASKNQVPQIRGNARRGEDQTITFSKDYDKSLQVPVYLTVKELLAEGDGAMDLLLAHQGDDRYSFSTNSSIDQNITVSQACEWIAKQKVLAYQPELHVITRSQFWLYPPQEESFRSWWGKNKKRGLAQLQVEGIDATLKFMTNVDGETALPWHPEANRLPIEEFDRRRHANLKTLKAIRQYIVATGRPYAAKTLDDHHSCIFGLPWSGRRHNK